MKIRFSKSPAMASQGVRWWYWGIDEWSPFPDFENEELEAAHRSGTEEVG